MILFIIVLALAAVVLIAAYCCYRMVFYSPVKGQNDLHRIPPGEQYAQKKEHMIELIDALATRPFERVSVTSYDGLRLNARYYHAAEGAPLAICFHGYRGSSIRDFCGGAKFCMALGQNVLLVDQRAQGESEGHTMTFGIKEKYDCLSWVDYAVKRCGGDVRIFLYGISMGAATVLLSAGEGLPPAVKGIIADSPYSSAAAIIKKVCLEMRLPPAVVYPFIGLGARLFGRFSLAAGDVSAAVSRSAVPLLIIHGEDDRFVPCEMSRGLKAAYLEKIRLETFPDAGHGISYLTDKERYEAVVKRFLADAGETV